MTDSAVYKPSSALRSIYPFAALAVGQSFFVAGMSPSAALTLCQNAQRVFPGKVYAFANYEKGKDERSPEAGARIWRTV